MHCRMMLALFAALLLWPARLAADSFRLYLSDGTYQQVREYKVEDERVRYYSTERSDWEEIPLRLVDLKKTAAERKQVDERVKKDAAADAAEEQFEREQAHEVALIPKAAGVYHLQGGKVETVKPAESKLVTNKKRSVLSRLSPLPLIGKATLELDGPHSAFVLAEARPTLWFRPSAEERFGMVRCQAKADSRIVETWYTEPVSKQMAAEHDEVEMFQQQVGEELYKIWPQKPLDPGEYAVIEYTEGQGNTQIWDFRIDLAAQKQDAAAPAPPPTK
jgi:hypothetical protein